MSVGILKFEFGSLLQVGFGASVKDDIEVWFESLEGIVGKRAITKENDFCS